MNRYFYLSKRTICCYCRFSSFARSAFMSINSVLSQPLDRRITEKRKKRNKILSNGCHTSNTLSTRPFYHYYFTPAMFCRCAAHFVRIKGACDGTHYTRISFTLSNNIFLAFVPIWFLFLFFCPLFSTSFHPLTMRRRPNFQFCRRFHRTRNNQCHHTKLNWWLIAIPIYP